MEHTDYDYLKRVGDIFNITNDKRENLFGLLNAKDIIKEISNHVKLLGLFLDAIDRYDKYVEHQISISQTEEEKIILTWIDFMEKAVSAPTRIHLRAVVILILPAVDKFLTEYENGKK